jgi:hypothetical protein
MTDFAEGPYDQRAFAPHPGSKGERQMDQRVNEVLTTAGTVALLALIGEGIARLDLFLVLARSAMLHRVTSNRL